jgi:hypothetical protein
VQFTVEYKEPVLKLAGMPYVENTRVGICFVKGSDVVKETNNNPAAVNCMQASLI